MPRRSGGMGLIMFTETKKLAGGGVKLLVRKWEPDAGAPQAKIIIVHGKGEHSGRYFEFAEYLMNQGFAVYTMDLRGHGLSGNRPGVCTPRKKVLGDVNLLINMALKEYPDGPLFIYGHSMGGNIVLQHRMLYSEGVAGYLVSAPWLKLYTPQPPALVLLAKIMSPLFGRLTVKGSIDNTTITSDPTELKIVNEDKLAHSYISFGTFNDVIRASKQIFASASSVNVPMLLVHGTNDNLIDPEGSRQFAELSGNCVRFVEFPGCKHEIHHDVGKAKEFELIAEYINEYIRKKASSMT
jgi:alpha-beta hydrolase superfamily lysophospholipase